MEKPCVEEVLKDRWNLNRKEKERLLQKGDELKCRVTGRNERGVFEEQWKKTDVSRMSGSS